MIKMPESKFMKIKCKKCRNEQIAFNRPAKQVKCLVCNSVLIETTGGLGRISKNVESTELVDS